jgi:hypothetical protein
VVGDALLIVPPMLKVVTGPLLGPAMLAGAARAAGLGAEVADLNAQWIREQVRDVWRATPRRFVGDHDRPDDLLRGLERMFGQNWLAPGDPVGDGERRMSMRMSHEEVEVQVLRLIDGRLGIWTRDALRDRPRPLVVGVSVMYAGQALAALVASVVARQLWPDAIVVWGGAHVTALRDEIARDARYGRFVDRFAFGYAERTWVELLRAVRDGQQFPRDVVRAGSGASIRARDDGGVVPAFDDLAWYAAAGRLTLPAQASRGCAYGRCEFCTYPDVEGEPRLLPLSPLSATVALAGPAGAAISFKDSLVVAKRLEAIAQMIDGRVRWSACTKLSRTLDCKLLRHLAAAGCVTLELGLETLTPEGQLLINKRQAWPLFLDVLDAAAGARIALVVNYMTGFPGVDAGEEEDWLERVRAAVSERDLIAKVEHNVFQLERRSPMGQQPARSGMRVTSMWPWSSVMEWAPVAAESVGVPKRLRMAL